MELIERLIYWFMVGVGLVLLVVLGWGETTSAVVLYLLAALVGVLGLILVLMEYGRLELPRTFGWYAGVVGLMGGRWVVDGFGEEGLRWMLLYLAGGLWWVVSFNFRERWRRYVPHLVVGLGVLFLGETLRRWGMNGEVPFVVGSLIGWVNGYKNHMFLGDLWSLVVMIGMTQIQRLKFPLIRPSSEMDKRHDKDQNEIRNTKFEIRNKFETQNSNTQTKSLRWFWWGLTIVGLGVVGWSQSRSAVAGIAVGVWMLWRYRHPGLDSGSIQTRAWIPDKAIRMRSRLYQDDEKEILDHVKRDTGKAKAFAGMTDKPWVRWFIGLALAGLFLWVSSYKSILRSRPYWVQSILGIYYYPLGVGMGGYDVVWQDSRVQWWPGGYSTLAHSLPLEFVVGLGVPGLVFSVWMAVHLLRLARPDYSPLLRGRAMAGVLWVVLGVNFLINTSYTVPALVLLWYWLLGVSDD